MQLEGTALIKCYEHKNANELNNLEQLI
jgi:hypothetical protein